MINTDTLVAVAFTGIITQTVELVRERSVDDEDHPPNGTTIISSHLTEPIVAIIL